jgi:hypothetical protein
VCLKGGNKDCILITVRCSTLELTKTNQFIFINIYIYQYIYNSHNSEGLEPAKQLLCCYLSVKIVTVHALDGSY